MRSRRILGFGVVFSMLLAAVATVALAAGVTSAEDDFSSGGYSGGTGWTGNWTESGDGGGSANSGAIQAVSGECFNDGCIRFQSVVGVSGSYHVSRRTNIDGASAVTLGFVYKTNGLGTISVATRSGPGDSWTQVVLTTSTGYKQHSMAITSDASDTTEIQFTMSTPLLVLLLASAYIDNVEITATYPATTTSTTTTSTTTTTTPASTTTTRPPIVTVPSLPIITVPTLPTTTSTTTTVAGEPRPTTTTAPSTTSTTTTTASGSDSGQPPDRGDGGEPPRDASENSGTIPPLSTAELSVARDNNIAVDLANGDDFKTFGVSPLTGLSVGLSSKVEVISTSVMSALALGGLIAFFAVRQKREDEDPRS